MAHPEKLVGGPESHWDSTYPQHGPILGPRWPILGPSWAQIWSSWVQKSHLGESWSPRAPKSSQDPSKPKNRSTFPPPSGGPFWEAFGAMFASKSHRKATQKAYEILIDFDVHFSSIFHRVWRGFGRFWEPCWLPRCTIN